MKSIQNILLPCLGGAAVLFALCAAKCETQTTFPPHVKEICNDRLDNDGDGDTDCRDSNCKEECRVSVSIQTIASPVKSDTLDIAGSHERAGTIVVSVMPAGKGGTAVPSGGTWKITLKELFDAGPYKVIAVASDSLGQGKVADTAEFTRVK